MKILKYPGHLVSTNPGQNPLYTYIQTHIERGSLFSDYALRFVRYRSHSKKTAEKNLNEISFQSRQQSLFQIYPRCRFKAGISGPRKAVGKYSNFPQCVIW